MDVASVDMGIIMDDVVELLKKRGLPTDPVFLDEEADGLQTLEYQHTPQRPDELDFSLYVTSLGSAYLRVGPFRMDNILLDTAKRQRGMAHGIADALQLLMNGQLSVVMTERAADKHWRAAELVYTDKKGVVSSVATIKNSQWGRGDSTVRLLRGAYTAEKIDGDDSFVLPPKVAGKFVVGRVIDLQHLTPMTKTQYAKIESSQNVQMMGGAANETDWKVFYRHVEFWITCLLVGVPAVWLHSLVPDTTEWWHQVLRHLITALVTMMITGITYLWLTARQAKIDRGEKPLFDNDSLYVNAKGILLVLALAMTYVIYYAPIWTPRSDPMHLYTGISQLQQLPYINTAVALMLGALILPRAARVARVLRMLLFSGGYALLLYVNYVLMISSDDGNKTAQAAELPSSFVTIVPAVIITWLLIDMLRKSPAENPMYRDWQ